MHFRAGFCHWLRCIGIFLTWCVWCSLDCVLGSCVLTCTFWFYMAMHFLITEHHGERDFLAQSVRGAALQVASFGSPI
jgi:hypothetical protein